MDKKYTKRYKKYIVMNKNTKNRIFYLLFDLPSDIIPFTP